MQTPQTKKVLYICVFFERRGDDVLKLILFCVKNVQALTKQTSIQHQPQGQFSYRRVHEPLID